MTASNFVQIGAIKLTCSPHANWCGQIYMWAPRLKLHRELKARIHTLKF